MNTHIIKSIKYKATKVYLKRSNFHICFLTNIDVLTMVFNIIDIKPKVICFYTEYE